MSTPRHSFPRFLAYVKPYWPYIVLATVGGIIKFCVPLVVPMISRHLVDNVFDNDAIAAQARQEELFHSVGWLAVVFLCVFAPGTFVRHYFAGRAGHKSVFDLRADLYYHIMRMSASFFSRNKTGAIVSRLMSDTMLAQNLVGTALTNVWMDGAALVVVLVLLLRIDAQTAAVALTTFPLYIYSFRKLGRRIKASSKDVQQEIAEISGNANEKISGSLVIHAFVQEHREQKRFHHDSNRLFSKQMRTSILQSVNLMVTGTLTNVAPLLVLGYGGWRVIHAHMTLGDLIATTMYLGPLYLPLQRFSELNVIFANSMAALDRIFEIMDERPEIASSPEALKLEHIEGKIEFDNVHFSYEAGRPILNGVSLHARPGERIALVGHSGSGKSTLVSLIPRFYDIDAGAIRIDGHDIRDVRVDSLRSHIGMVLQDPVLFSGSVRDNIMYGRPHAGDEELLAATRAANALEFVEALPEGFDTEIGERGVFLSGGQKQRLTIARAFLKNPRILLLDEPTSALDAASEQLIQEALGRLMIGRTTVIIAHRLATITEADQILVMDDGFVIERGSHAELLAEGRVYRALYEQQFSSAQGSLEILHSAR